MFTCVSLAYIECCVIAYNINFCESLRSCKRSLGVKMRVSSYSQQGRNAQMEDFLSVVYQHTDDGKDLEYAFIGIFDGHNGSEAAAFAKEHLMASIVREKSFMNERDEDVLKALRAGFINTHLAMWKEQDKWPRTASGLPSVAGTTASVAFIRRGKIYTGHVGDSGIILGYQQLGHQNWLAERLTHDHKPECRAELQRIEQCGGKVVTQQGVSKVVWYRPQIGHRGPITQSTPFDEIPFLTVARSLGDLWSLNAANNKFAVSPVPDTQVINISIDTFRCLIFGTDGIWKMITPVNAVSIVQAAAQHNAMSVLVEADAGSKNPSISLVECERWNSTSIFADNTSVLTLIFDRPEPLTVHVIQKLPVATTTTETTPQPVPTAESITQQSTGLQILTRYEGVRNGQQCGQAAASSESTSSMSLSATKYTQEYFDKIHLEPRPAIEWQRIRRRRSVDEESTSAKHMRYCSPRATGSSDQLSEEDTESTRTHSVQEKETDYAKDTNDMDTRSDTSHEYYVGDEYDVVSTSEEEKMFTDDSSSGNDAALLAAGAVEASVSEEQSMEALATDGDDEREPSSSDFVEQPLDSLAALLVASAVEANISEERSQEATMTGRDDERDFSSDFEDREADFQARLSAAGMDIASMQSWITGGDDERHSSSANFEEQPAYSQAALLVASAIEANISEERRQEATMTGRDDERDFSSDFEDREADFQARLSAAGMDIARMQSFATGGDDERQSSSSNFEEQPAYSQKCRMCKARETVGCLPLCSHCHQIRKTYFPLRPRNNRRKHDTSSSTSSQVTRDSLRSCLSGLRSSKSSQESGIGSIQKLQPVAWDNITVPENSISKAPDFEQSTNEPKPSSSEAPKEHSSSLEDELMSKNTCYDYGWSDWALATKEKCILCNEMPKNGIFMHGSGAHMCCCYKCAVKYWNRSKRCAYCNRKVKNVIKAFVV